LIKGDLVSILHKEDSMVMGIFKITEIREDAYYAVAHSSIDPVFGGFIRDRGSITIVPNMVATHIPQGERND
jgi:hypothetical protein